MKIITINYEAVQRIGKNNLMLNIYKYRYIVYIEDDRKSPYGSTMRYENETVKVKVAFTGTKPEVKKWLKTNCLVWNW